MRNMGFMKKHGFASFLVAALLCISNAHAGPFPFSFWANQACVDVPLDFTVRATTLTGSVIRHGFSCSPNGTYCFGVAAEKLSGDPLTYHFYYSADSSVTWTKAAYTLTTPSGVTFSEDRTNDVLMSPKVLVADNGKAMAIFNGKNPASGFISVEGVYSDLSIGSPVVTATAAVGVDAENSVGTAGSLANNSGVSYTGHLEGDLSDLSFVIVAINRDNNTLGLRFFTAGGATYQNSDLSGYAQHYMSRVGLTVTGTGSSHRAYVFNKASTTNISDKLYDQPSATPVQNTVVLTGDYYVYDCGASASKGYCLVRDNATDAPQYFSWNIAGTPTYSSLKILSSQLDLDEYIGLDTIENSAAQAYNYGKVPGPQVVINSSDTNNVFFVTDLLHPDTVVRPGIHEVRDDTAFLGEGPTNFSTVGFSSIGSGAGSAYDGQVVTLSSQRPRTFGMIVRQNGTIPSGAITCEIKATTGAVPNAIPTGAALYTSTNSYSAPHLSKNSSGQWVFCDFDAPALTGVYAVSMKTTHPLHASNNTSKSLSTSNPYANGNYYTCDNTDVCTANSASDIVFTVSGEWTYNLASVADERSAMSGIAFWGTDSSISATSTAGQISFITKASPSGISAVQRRQAGHVYKSNISIGSGSTASTIGTISAIGYAAASFDKALVYESNLGTTESARKDAITGVVSTTEMAEDRSGLGSVISAYTSMTFGNQAAFTSGKSGVFNTTSSKIVMSTVTAAHDLLTDGSPFFIEVEFLLNTLPSVKGQPSIIASDYFDGNADPGWLLYVDTGNQINFGPSGGTLTNTESVNTVTTGTRYKLRITGDGTTVRMELDDVEVTYNTQNTTAYNVGANSHPLAIGNVYNTSIYGLGGEIGYIKLGKGTSTPVATAYFSQPELLHPINAGKTTALLKGVGTGSATINTGFNQWGTVSSSVCSP